MLLLLLLLFAGRGQPVGFVHAQCKKRRWGQQLPQRTTGCRLALNTPKKITSPRPHRAQLGQLQQMSAANASATSHVVQNMRLKLVMALYLKTLEEAREHWPAETQIEGTPQVLHKCIGCDSAYTCRSFEGGTVELAKGNRTALLQ